VRGRTWQVSQLIWCPPHPVRCAHHPLPQGERDARCSWGTCLLAAGPTGAPAYE
jgi:hypothetical protein